MKQGIKHPVLLVRLNEAMSPSLTGRNRYPFLREGCLLTVVHASSPPSPVLLCLHGVIAATTQSYHLLLVW